MNTWSLTTLALFISAASPFASSPSTSSPSNGDTTVLLGVETLQDSQRGLPSHEVLVPEGWRAEGGGWWPEVAFSAMRPSQDIAVSAPDGTFVHVLPRFEARNSTTRAEDGGLRATYPEGSAKDGYPIVHAPDDLDEWRAFVLEHILGREHPALEEVQITAAFEFPELERSVDKSQPTRTPGDYARTPAPFAGDPAPRPSEKPFEGRVGEASGLGFAWSATRLGVRFEGLVMLTSRRNETKTKDTREVAWTLESAATLGAREGALEAQLPLLLAVAGSVRPTTAWTGTGTTRSHSAESVARRQPAGAQPARRVPRREPAIAEPVFPAVDRRILANQDEDGACQDTPVRARFLRMIGNVAEFAGGGSRETVRLPVNYEAVFRSADGEVLLTADRQLDPNLDPRLGTRAWKPMKLAR